MFIIYKLHTKHSYGSYSLRERECATIRQPKCVSVRVSGFACKYTMDLFIRRFWLMMTKQYYFVVLLFSRCSGSGSLGSNSSSAQSSNLFSFLFINKHCAQATNRYNSHFCVLFLVLLGQTNLAGRVTDWR